MELKFRIGKIEKKLLCTKDLSAKNNIKGNRSVTHVAIVCIYFFRSCFFEFFIFKFFFSKLYQVYYFRKFPNYFYDFRVTLKKSFQAKMVLFGNEISNRYKNLLVLFCCFSQLFFRRWINLLQQCFSNPQSIDFIVICNVLKKSQSILCIKKEYYFMYKEVPVLCKQQSPHFYEINAATANARVHALEEFHYL